jgi:hypothetical protein
MITRLQRVEQRRAEYDGTPVHGATLANAACAACGAIEGDPDASAIGLCATCDAGPLCDSCADQHEATARHPATL